jgi:hypothetical protein
VINRARARFAALGAVLAIAGWAAVVSAPSSESPRRALNAAAPTTDASSATAIAVTTSTSLVTATTATTVATSPASTVTTRGRVAPHPVSAAPGGSEAGPECRWSFGSPRETRTEYGQAMTVNVSVNRPDLAGHDVDFIVSNTASPDGDDPQTYRAQPVTGDAEAGTFSVRVPVPPVEGGEMVVTAHPVDGGVSDCTSERHPVVFPPGSRVTTSTTAPSSGG